MEPVVSVVMAVYNGEKFLHHAIKSILLQTYNKYEFIIINDGSTDKSGNIAASYNDRRIRIIENEKNIGLNESLNIGIDYAQGKYIARMDADDICFPTRFAQQLNMLESNSSLDMVGSKALVFNDTGDIQGLFPYRQTHAEICRRPSRGFYLPHPTWMGKTEWFKKFRYGMEEVERAEDQDLLLRSYRTSKFACLDEVLLGYRQNDLPLQSALKGRRSFRLAVVRDALQHGLYGNIPIVIVEQFMKGIYEQSICALGMQKQLLRHRARRGIETELQDRWQEIWNRCHS